MSRARAPGTRPPPPPLLLLLPLLLCPTVRGDCGLPPDIPNATPSLEGKTSFPEKSSVVYTCNKGYQEIPNKLNTATCLNGSWSNLETFCNQSCDAPTMVPFASLKKIYISVNYFPIGTVVEYECRPGYLRVPSLSGKSTCLANLEWSKIDEICKKKSCPNPGDLSNGHINIPKGLLFGSKIQFSCNTGYKLVGSTFSFCVVSGDSVNWDRDIPTCVEIFCPDPPKISNGEIHGESDSYVYRQVVTYTCAKGFLLVGEHSIYCNVNQGYGEWSGPPPSCLEKSTIPTTPPKPTTVHIAGTTVLSTSKRPTTATPYVPATKTTVQRPTRTSKVNEKSTSGGDHLIYAPALPSRGGESRKLRRSQSAKLERSGGKHLL
ncbi:complement decay-accelerating factor isoform X1 [Psammomys obesus]|uniref:complement decay-accelerating factor isoform X1 n=1 Tax=Psammomys obesus TaxID=48139 RepID=UPI00245324D2|nr:complement decay-accelerating factor isoform X1 [Psammomys obesus]